jgi:predicted nucleotidyltransferase component of viral defense system
MSEFFDAIKERLNHIDVDDKNNQMNELREISQEIILYSLAKEGFFSNVAFMGGTALRLIHGLDRYSEDLDFRFLKEDKYFDWKKYYDLIKNNVQKLGGNIEYKDESNKGLKRAYFSDDALIENINKNKIFDLGWAKNKAGKFEVIEVQLDISYKQPKFGMETKTLLFPKKYEIEVFDIHSLCAGKIKAILTRRDKKGNEINVGRDWFDLNWFIKKGIEPNFKFLFESLVEDKKYRGKEALFSESFIKNELFNRARDLNFREMNITVENLTTRKNRLIFDRNNVKDIIRNFGKDGFLVKYKKKE